MSEQTEVKTQTEDDPTSLDPAQEEQLVELVQKAKQHIEEGDAEAGLAAFHEIAQSFPTIPEVFNNLGAICTAMDRFTDAQAAFERAVALSPDNSSAYYNLGMVLFRQGDYVSASDNFLKSSELSPEDPEILNNLGVSYFQLERWSQAREVFDRALSILPDYVSPQMNLVDVDLAEGRLDDAYERCRPLAEESKDYDAWIKLMECASQRAERSLDDTAEICESALGIFGDDVAMRASFGRAVRARQVLLEETESTAG